LYDLPPALTLFPYTTLFRSRPQPQGRGEARRTDAPLRRGRLRLRRRQPDRPAGVGGRPRGAGRVAVEEVAGTGRTAASGGEGVRSEEHTSELQSQSNLVCRL